MPAAVNTSPNRIFIEGVPPFSYSQGRDSLVLSMNSAAASIDRAVSYAALKGRSALAFRLVFHPNWRRFSPDALCGYDHTDHILNALGITGALIAVDTADNAAVEESRDVIRRSLAGGYPLLGMHLMDYEDWGVIAGITEDGRLLCQTPHNESDDLAEHKHWPTHLLRINGEGNLPDPPAVLANALRIAVKIHSTKNFCSFYSGRAAYRFWINSLQDEEEFSSLESRGEQPYEGWVRGLLQEDKDNFSLDACYNSHYLERAHVNAWRMESLIDARRSAADYLRESAEMLAGNARARVARAADLYARQVAVLVETRPNYSWEWNLPEQPWNTEKRADQAKSLAEALKLESAAVKEILALSNRYV